ncbi:MAG: repair protein radA protein [Candidatus Gottesmanbacteria bacterium GW2011_GWB1_43_11]|uniref:DNA repair protein RadA n=1 Tax=Candidatus Gottesmanbacteria bacterium GW2011_GWB1_43_11 TaxID=1618446 RepID=A0A0G1FI04_9BACT|nr:MAG: repair protein radA protein [Candidatus Gottesmanbacteria bacterium GW2011_GWA1_42_26]KKS81369.1 MAG: repair protein radA protein [Candidatus Gottesmanbacteria bacterium GW2011_GWC1_43_10]KKS86488.1 MAG: repair protein radA protein [Candidatus Gottesmanbacteria bacterium GW2011_GWB1_43_11]OGG10451.1 MAG: DNA repair protein RadA [Candidatus Gottesmanbacteria bacterium RIFCSPHIGHO2_01_FULL_43_15]HCM38309.1 DNA repair protein RadA [Patescibacteria group bacterium]
MKTRSSFVCQQCGNESGAWFGKCPSCGAWNSLVETVRVTGKTIFSAKSTTSSVKPLPLAQIKSVRRERISTEMVEFDRVLGGGIVPGVVILIAGDPGVGKSTLLLSLVGKIGGWYVTGEESAEQVKMRAERLGISKNDLYILPETNIESILSAVETASVKPQIMVIDSIQTMTSESLEGIAGSVGQIRQSTQLLLNLAKSQQVAIFIVGHVTKEGTIAGPKLLEHMVDVVCYFEGERYYQGRILRTLKNRFGPTDEVGIFEMNDSGLTEISNPSKIFLEGRVKNVSGSTVGVTLEGTRPLLVEIQSLVVPTQLAMPRRVVNGIDYNRLQVILAILQKRLNLPFGNFDVFVNVSGGLKLKEPATDLPVALSLISAFKNKPLPNDLASFGELGLLGELRRVQGEDKRTKEAKRLGFTSVLSPEQKNLQQVCNPLWAT